MEYLETGMSFVYGIVQLLSIIAVFNSLFNIKIKVTAYTRILVCIIMGITYFIFGQINGKWTAQILLPLILILLSNGIRKLYCCIYIIPTIYICNSLVFSLGILFRYIGFEMYFTNLILQYFIMSIAQITVVWYIRYRISSKKAVLCLGIKEAVWITSVGLVYNYIYNLYFSIDAVDQIQYGCENIQDLCIQIILFISSITIFIGILENKISSFLSTESQKKCMMLELQQQQFKEYKSYQTEIKKFHHDISNHIICMSILLRDKKYDDLAEYMMNIKDKVITLSPAANTGNDILDAILCGKIGILDEENITYKIDGRFLYELNAAVSDLCSIFANAIDNAIEANCRITDIQARELTITICNDNLFSVINFINPIILSDTNLFESKKKDIEYHGFGLDIMRSSVERCKGSIEFVTENGTFIVSIVLPVKE